MRSFLFLALLLTSTGLWAQTVRFEPLYGVEHTQNRYPEPARYSTRTFFGLRVLAGVPLISLELEGTQSNSRRDYPGDNEKVEDEVQRAMVGLRSTYAIASYLAFYLRAGARATKEKTTITDTLTDEKEVKEPPLYWDPYAGTGVQISVANNLALSAGATWVFTDSGRPDVQYTFGFTVKFGQAR
ncbi:MAG: hypothetical protein ACLGG0_13790 [Bacteriovoracia bacterium]